MIKTDGRKKIEYSDDFETQEVKEIIFNYNELISRQLSTFHYWKNNL